MKICGCGFDPKDESTVALCDGRCNSNTTEICPMCDHEQDEAECFIGRLGFLAHFRCRYCGWMFSRDTREGI